MSISLEYLLRRKRSSLESFVKKNRLTSYNELVKYCKSRNLIPCEKEEYDNIVVQKEVKKSVNEKKEVKKKPAVTRKTSKTSKTKKGRNTTKKE